MPPIPAGCAGLLAAAIPIFFPLSCNFLRETGIVLVKGYSQGKVHPHPELAP